MFSTLRKLWTPIYIKEGDVFPRWYGCSRFIPIKLSMKEPDPAAGIWQWRRIAYPIPMNLFFSFYYWLSYKLRVGWSLPPDCYRSYSFKVYHRCPHCDNDLYEFPTQNSLHL